MTPVRPIRAGRKQCRCRSPSSTRQPFPQAASRADRFLRAPSPRPGRGLHPCPANLAALNERERRTRSSAPAQIDALFELAKLGRNAPFHRCETILLGGIVDRQSLERIEARSNFLRRCAVWTEISLVAGEQIAPLAGFGVFHRGEHIFQCG